MKKDPTTAFAANIEEARRMASTILGHIDEHLGYSPDAIKWGHVGSAGHLVAQLREILDQLEGKE